MSQHFDVMNFWYNHIDHEDRSYTPTFKSPKTWFNVDHVKTNSFCAIYFVIKDQEYFVAVGDEILDNSEFLGTSHQKCFQHALQAFGFSTNQKVKYFAGFWQNKVAQKFNSCANIICHRTRQLSKTEERMLKENVLPILDDYLANGCTTICMGITKRMKPCKNRVACGRFCWRHVNQTSVIAIPPNPPRAILTTSTRVQCCAIAKSTKHQCRRTVLNGLYCFQHIS